MTVIATVRAAVDDSIEATARDPGLAAPGGRLGPAVSSAASRRADGWTSWPWVGQSPSIPDLITFSARAAT